MNDVPQIFDARLLAARRARARALAVPGADFLFERAAADLGERLAAIRRSFASAAIIGPDTGALADALAATVPAHDIVTVPIEAGAGGERIDLPPATLDLVASVLALQFVNDLPGVLTQIRRALKGDGLFLGVLAGGETLRELREVLTIAETEIRGGAASSIDCSRASEALRVCDPGIGDQ